MFTEAEHNLLTTHLSTTNKVTRFSCLLLDLDNIFLPQVVKESDEILAHLNRVVLGLGHAENAQLAVLPCSVLLQQKREQHQKAAVVDDPPDVNVALDFVPGIRIPLNAFGHEQGHFGRGRVPDGVDEHAP